MEMIEKTTPTYKMETLVNNNYIFLISFSIYNEALNKFNKENYKIVRSYMLQESAGYFVELEKSNG